MPLARNETCTCQRTFFASKKIKHKLARADPIRTRGRRPAPQRPWQLKTRSCDSLLLDALDRCIDDTHHTVSCDSPRLESPCCLHASSCSPDIVTVTAGSLSGAKVTGKATTCAICACEGTPLLIAKTTSEVESN